MRKFKVSRFLFLTSILAFGISYSLYSQPIQLNGYLIDASTQEPIPYAHLSIVNSGYGTYSNLDGRFNFNVPYGIGLILKVSSIGYKQKSLDLKEFDFSKEIIISLEPSVQELASFEIQAKKSKEKVNAAKIVANAIELISNNRYNSSLRLNAFYRQIQYIENSQETQYLKIEEAALQIDRSSKLDDIKVVETRSSFDIRNKDWLKEKVGQTVDCDERKGNLSQLMKSDYIFYNEHVRTKNEISDYSIWTDGLNSNFVKTHNFKFDRFDLVDGELVYVIKILPSRKSLNYYPVLGKNTLIPVGKMIIREKDWGVMEMEYAYILNPQVRNKTDFDYQLAQLIIQGNILFKDVIRYTDFENKLVLTYLSRDVKDFCAVSTGTGSFLRNVNGTSSYKPGQIEGTSYYRTKHELFINLIDKSEKKLTSVNQNVYLSKPVTYNGDFWNNYSILILNNFDKRYIKNLEAITPLQEQFKVNQH